MWSYYVALALRSSARSKALTALVVVLLGVGVACCMVSYAVFRATTSDPLPSRSAQLYVPQIDNFGPSPFGTEPPPTLSYTDAMALWQAHKGSRQTLVYPTKWGVEADDGSSPALSMKGDAVTADFFGMFAVPFRFGTGWSASDDAQHASVAVISEALNERLFHGKSSVGQEIRLDGKVFRVVGVLDDWNPRPRFFDLGTFGPLGAFDNTGDIYVPFSRAIDMQKSAKYDLCPSYSQDLGIVSWKKYLDSECDWISAWVELPTPTDAAHFRDYLHNYAEEQQRLGRFSWPPNVRLHKLMDWLTYMHVTPKASSLSMLVSASFLLIVLVNVVGLMLARFMRRAPEVGVRRALGASRSAVYRQFLVEGATLGCLGGLLGVALTVLGIWGASTLFTPHIARLVHVDAALVALTAGVAIIATIVCAIFPTWRAARTQPAWQIKIH